MLNTSREKCNLKNSRERICIKKNNYFIFQTIYEQKEDYLICITFFLIISLHKRFIPKYSINTKSYLNNNDLDKIDLEIKINC